MSMQPIEKRLAIALAVSLGLNLFFAGFVVARRMANRAERERPGFMLGPRGFFSRAGLGEDAKLQRVLEARRDKLRGERQALMQARDAVRTALQAEAFDATKLEAALQALRAHSAAMQSEMHATLLELARQLSPAERARLSRAPWLLAPEPPPNRMDGMDDMERMGPQRMHGPGGPMHP